MSSHKSHQEPAEDHRILDQVKAFVDEAYVSVKNGHDPLAHFHAPNFSSIKVHPFPIFIRPLELAMQSCSIRLLQACHHAGANVNDGAGFPFIFEIGIHRADVIDAPDDFLQAWIDMGGSFQESLQKTNGEELPFATHILWKLPHCHEKVMDIAIRHGSDPAMTAFETALHGDGPFLEKPGEKVPLQYRHEENGEEGLSCNVVLGKAYTIAYTMAKAGFLGIRSELISKEHAPYWSAVIPHVDLHKPYLGAWLAIAKEMDPDQFARHYDHLVARGAASCVAGIISDQNMHDILEQKP